MAAHLIPDQDPRGPRRLPIKEALDCVMAQQAARQVAKALGFAEAASEEVALVATELASNVVKHAGHGTLTMRPVYKGDCNGIEILAEDQGPGMVNVERSWADGYSTAGSLGYGLGTVNRLMDEVDIVSTPGLGTRIACQRWLRPDRTSPVRLPWETGIVTRSRRFAPANGDAFVLRESQNQLLVGVIDGLGHGEPAQQAAMAAQQYIQSHAGLELDKIFRGVSRACRATRGVVMALALFKSPSQLSFASIGNIEVRAWTRGERLYFLPQRGILGLNEPDVVVHNFRWQPGWLLVMHTDGLRSQWQWTDFPGLERESAQSAATRLMRSLASEDDDATVVTLRMPEL